MCGAHVHVVSEIQQGGVLAQLSSETVGLSSRGGAVQDLEAAIAERDSKAPTPDASPNSPSRRASKALFPEVSEGSECSGRW